MFENTQFIFMALSDMAIVILLIFILLLISKKNSKSESEELSALKMSFEKSMAESEKISKDMLRSFNKRISEFNDILSELDERYTRIRLDILKSVEISEKLNLKSAAPDTGDPYRKAVDMLAAGHSIEEIQTESGLSENEITLIKQLSHVKNLKKV